MPRWFTPCGIKICIAALVVVEPFGNDDLYLVSLHTVLLYTLLHTAVNTACAAAALVNTMRWHILCWCVLAAAIYILMLGEGAGSNTTGATIAVLRTATMVGHSGTPYATGH